jgi:DNA-binding transcriptional MerR regulator
MTTAVRNDPFLVQKPARPETLAPGAIAKGPDAFRTIGEAAAELGLRTHVLRFWETKFDALKPMKRPDGRRYYRPEDMETLRRLQQLLHVQGLTIRGAVKALDGRDVAGEIEDESEILAPVADEDLASPVASVRDLQDAVRSAVERGEFRALEEAAVSPAAISPARERLEALLTDLSDLKSRLDAVRSAA